MVSSLPTAQCSPGRTGGGRGSHKPHHVQHRGRWGSSTLPLRPCLLLAAGWGGTRTRSCSPSLVSHAARWREATVTRCPAEERGGDEEMPRPLKKDTLPAPRALLPTPWPQRGDISQHTSPALLQAQPAVPGCLEQAGPGKHRRWLQDGHPGMSTAAPREPPAAGEASLHRRDLAGSLGARSPGRSPGRSQSQSLAR